MAKRVLLMRLSAMGDVAMTVPVVASFAKAYPDIDITMLSTPRFQPLFANIPNLKFIGVDKTGRHKGIRGLWRLSKEITADGDFDQMIDLHDVLRSKMLRTIMRFRGSDVIVVDKGREEKKALVEAFNNGDLVAQVNKVFIRLQSELREADLIDRAQRVTEKVKCGSVLRDLYTAHILYDYINDMRQPLAEMTIDWLNENIKLDFARQQVLALNEKYEALSRKDFSNSTNLLSTDNLEGITEGEQILRKIIEPWKGKIILIDVWGTWCGPCKEALKHSQELYERMKPYDMFFLYMANNSSETSWKNVINEYNVTGENVGHVNLPADQQSAVEDFLKVNSYPSYFLIDREGHLLEVNADPRNLDQFEELVKRVGK